MTLFVIGTGQYAAIAITSRKEGRYRYLSGETVDFLEANFWGVSERRSTCHRQFPLFAFPAFTERVMPKAAPAPQLC
jgi:hypothetical protein